MLLTAQTLQAAGLSRATAHRWIARAISTAAYPVRELVTLTRQGAQRVTRALELSDSDAATILAAVARGADRPKRLAPARLDQAGRVVSPARVPAQISR